MSRVAGNSAEGDMKERCAKPPGSSERDHERWGRCLEGLGAMKGSGGGVQGAERSLDMDSPRVFAHSAEPCHVLSSLPLGKRFYFREKL